jgi:methionyl-tRNA synthetase
MSENTTPEENEVTKHLPDIVFDDFAKLEMRTAKVVHVEKVENADKLLKFTLGIGDTENRTVVSSVAEFYKPEDLINKTVIYLANLMPRKFRGVLSQGMILFAEIGDDKLSLLKTEDEMPVGCPIR